VEKSKADRKIKELGELAYLAEREHAISCNDTADEATQDAAYEEYWIYLRQMAEVIIDLIHVDKKTATRMAAQKSSEILALVKRLAA